MNTVIIDKAIQIWKDENASRENYGFSVSGHITEENYSTAVVWNNGIDEKGFGIPMEAPISWSDLQAYITQANEYFTSQEYASARARAYTKELGGWREQLDMMYHDQVNGTTTWKDAIAKVKADNPKS